MLEMNLFDTVDLLTSCCEPLLYLAMKSACLQGVRVVTHEALATMQKIVRYLSELESYPAVFVSDVITLYLL